MAIIGFNFTKILVEKKVTSTKGNIDIKNNVSVKNVESLDFNLGTAKQKVVKFTFEFTS